MVGAYEVWEDNFLVCIFITTHLFDSILGSEGVPCPMLALSPQFMMFQPLVIEILLVLLYWGRMSFWYLSP